MKACIEEGVLLIEVPIEEYESKSGKSIVIASTHGNVTTSMLHNGKPVVVSVNAYVKK